MHAVEDGRKITDQTAEAFNIAVENFVHRFSSFYYGMDFNTKIFICQVFSY